MADDAIVVGGGLAGSSVAFHLAQAGLAVRLLECATIGGEASGAAAGMLLPVGEAAGKDALLQWGARSLAAFPDLADAVQEHSGIDPELEPSGALHLARGEGGRQALREKARSVVAFGADWLDAQELGRRVPWLAGRADGALWCPREGHVRSEALVRGLAASAEALGARIETGCEVEAILRDGERVTGVTAAGRRLPARHVVVCTGAFAARPSPQGLPPEIPVEPVRGQMLALDGRRRPLPHVVMAEDVYLVPRRDGEIWVGATEEHVGFDRRVTAEGVAGLLDAALALAPALEDCPFQRAWAGLRPATPDGLPLIGEVPGAPGLVLALGHYRNGVLLAPVTGQLVAGLLRDGHLPDDAAPFAVDRFLRSSPHPVG